jgi:hypothetical protein
VEIIVSPRRFGDRQFTRAELIARVREHDAGLLLALLAQQSARYPFADSWESSPEGAFVGWALVEIARTTIARGRDSGRAAVLDDLIDLAAIELNSDDNTTLTTPESEAAWLLRNLLHQHRYAGLSDFDWVRAFVILTRTPWPAGKQPAKFLIPGWDERALGMPLADYIHAVMMIHWTAMQRGNQFHRSFFSGQSAANNSGFNAQHGLQTLDRFLAISVEEFKREELAIVRHSSKSLHPKYRENPLWARPLVQVAPDRYLVPSSRLLIARAGTQGIYYSVPQADRSQFAIELGILFEDYTGAQLRSVPGTTAQPERRVGPKGSSHLTVDWVWLLPKITILVEVKARRPAQILVAGDTAAALTELKKKLDKGFRQLNRDFTDIQNHEPWTSFIPKNKPIYGLLVTLETFTQLNLDKIRDVLTTARFPVSILSSERLEALVSLGAERIEAAVLNASDGGPAFELEDELLGTAPGANTLLSAIVSAGVEQRSHWTSPYRA